MLSESDLKTIQAGCDEQGYIPYLSHYLEVEVRDHERLKEITREKFVTIPGSRFDRFLTLRAWLLAFETYFRFQKPFYFPHIDPHILSQNRN